MTPVGEWLLDWVPNIPTRALKLLYREIKANSGWVIRGWWRDDHGGGCVAEWAGRAHRACFESPYPA